MDDARLGSWAEGYDNERDVFDAVANGTKFALVDPSVLPEGFNQYEFNVSDDVTVDDERFDAFDLQYIDTVTRPRGHGYRHRYPGHPGRPRLSRPASTSPRTPIARPSATPTYLRTYVRLNDGVKANQAAQDIEAALITHGVQAESIRVLLDDVVAQNNSFMRMFQGFMALGLLTGIAALGVIAFRSVVERRQQIGMLRAIGYQTGTVAMTFVLESGFIAVMGILSGVVSGMIISHNLFTTGQFSGNGIEFAIPWTEIIVITGSALFFSLLMTYLPARQAARVPVAEALRYE